MSQGDKPVENDPAASPDAVAAAADALAAMNQLDPASSDAELSESGLDALDSLLQQQNESETSPSSPPPQTDAADPPVAPSPPAPETTEPVAPDPDNAAVSIEPGGASAEPGLDALESLLQQQNEFAPPPEPSGAVTESAAEPAPPAPVTADPAAPPAEAGPPPRIDFAALKRAKPSAHKPDETAVGAAPTDASATPTAAEPTTPLAASPEPTAAPVNHAKVPAWLRPIDSATSWIAAIPKVGPLLLGTIGYLGLLGLSSSVLLVVLIVMGWI